MTSSSSSPFVVDDLYNYKLKKINEGDYAGLYDSSSIFAGAYPVGVTNLMENIKGLEHRLSALEKSYAAKLKEHEETVEMLLKVIKDAT